MKEIYRFLWSLIIFYMYMSKEMVIKGTTNLYDPCVSNNMVDKNIFQ